MTVIIFLIILAILVLVHELGHFITAKKSGIRVDEFGIGFPPTVFSWKPKKSETKYSLNLIPFGGFVKIFGEDPDEASIRGPESKRSLTNKPKSIQILVLASGIIFNIIFAWALLSFGFMWGLPLTIDETNEQYAQNIDLTITAVLPDSPAEGAELKTGDNIIELVQGSFILENPNSDEVKEFISKNGEKEFLLKYRRGKELGEVSLIGNKEILENEIAVGIGLDRVGIVKFPLLKSIKEGTVTTIKLLGLITVGLANFISDAFTGEADFSQVSGPVGIIGLVGNASALGFVYLLTFTALISLHLAIINLIPFPALDGGRILFVIIESIKGSPISPKIQNWINGIGFALLILLMFVITYNDILKLF